MDGGSNMQGEGVAVMDRKRHIGLVILELARKTCGVMEVLALVSV